MNFVSNQMEILEEMWLRLDELVHVDDDVLVGAVSFGGRAAHTGIDVEIHPFHVFLLREGKVLRWRVFANRAKALAAAGLEA